MHAVSRCSASAAGRAAPTAKPLQSVVNQLPKRPAITNRSSQQCTSSGRDHAAQTFEAGNIWPANTGVGVDTVPSRVTSGVGIISISSLDEFEEEEGLDPVDFADEQSLDLTVDELSEAGPELDYHKELQDLLADGGHNLTLGQIARLFPFQLDNFQAKALQKMLLGSSVVVCAPTGAGKTAIAEAAAVMALARGQRVIYTTPLKALSNQKLLDMRRFFGPARCGLQTGDTKLNTEADVVVMTTEILRNIMYRTAEDGTTDGSASRDGRLLDVALIVLDEVHFLGDTSRGSVWEEVIINCPRHIQLLCMSATVKNPEELAEWINQEHGECVCVKTRFRPVPLRFVAALSLPGGVFLKPLLDPTNRRLNPALETDRLAMNEAKRMLSAAAAMDAHDAALYLKGLGPALRALISGNGRDDPARRDALTRRLLSRVVPDMRRVVELLRASRLLPAIWFILSRRDCDLSALRISSTLTTHEERKVIERELRQLKEEQPEALRVKFEDALLRGVSCHHAGCLPAWKSLVERLFARGLVKLVFATGTLAAGINMPARTTLVAALSRKTAEGPALLQHNELMQMAGRAGRRGFDKRGTCVVVPNRFDVPERAWTIMRGGPEPLRSQFSTSYSLVLNLLSTHTLDEARDFISRSFSNYQGSVGNRRRLQQIEQLECQAAELEGRVAERERLLAEAAEGGQDAQELAVGVLSSQLSAAHEALSELRRVSALQALAAAGGLPRRVELVLPAQQQQQQRDTPTAPHKHKRAFALRELPPNQVPPGAPLAAAPYLACLADDNRLMCVAAQHVFAVVEGEGGAVPPAVVEEGAAALCAAQPCDWAVWSSGDEVSSPQPCTCWYVAGTGATAVAALQLQVRGGEAVAALSALAPGEGELLQRIQQLQQDERARLLAHAKSDARKKGGGMLDGSVTAMRQRAARRRAAAAELRQELEDATAATWRSFLDVLDVLVAKGAVDAHTLEVLPLGVVARSLQCANELWMALALTQPAVAGLTGPQLAALLAALLAGDTLRRASSVWTAYQVSPALVQVVESLECEREALCEVQASMGLGKWNESMQVDLRLSGLVEAWAQGVAWRDMMADCELEDGDVARLLFRTVDMLRQVSRCSLMLPWIREAATQAVSAMDRQPVTGDVE